MSINKASHRPELADHQTLAQAIECGGQLVRGFFIVKKRM